MFSLGITLGTWEKAKTLVVHDVGTEFAEIQRIYLHSMLV